jgi:hypothetical protein
VMENEWCGFEKPFADTGLQVLNERRMSEPKPAMCKSPVENWWLIKYDISWLSRTGIFGGFALFLEALQEEFRFCGTSWSDLLRMINCCSVCAV